MGTLPPRHLMVTPRTMTPEEQAHLKQGLRNAVLFIGALKWCSAICYLGLFALVKIYSEGFWSSLLGTMILILVPLEIANGVLLFLGALEIKPVALKVAALMCLFVAVFNTVLGVIGALFFFRVGTRVIHFVISFIFALIALCFCSVVRYDVIIIFMLIQMLENPSGLTSNPQGTVAIAHHRSSRPN